MSKPRLKEIQFIKVISAFGIILYHFSCHSNCLAFSNIIGNGPLGIYCVNMFFIASGVVLYYSYNKITSLKLYYYRRWKSIFVMFLMVYFFVYCMNVINTKQLFYGPQPWKIIFSLIGIDGYLWLYNVSTYYILGEWFLGALLFVYIVYPLIAYILNKYNKGWIFLLVLIVLGYVVVVFLDNNYPCSRFIGNHQQHLISCLLTFYFGVLYIKFREKFQNVFTGIMTLALSVICFVFPSFIDPVVVVFINSLCIFIWISIVSKKLMNNKLIANIISKLDKLVLPMYFLQHMIILWILGSWNPINPVKAIVILIIIYFIIIVFSQVLNIVTRSVSNSPTFNKIENLIKLKT